MLEQAQLLWNEYYPLIVASIGGLIVFVGVAYGVYNQVSVITAPILEKIQAFRDKNDEDAITNKGIEDIKLDVLKADILAKIGNPSVSPELTLLYQTQLDKLNAMTTKVSDTVNKVEEKTDKYL